MKEICWFTSYLKDKEYVIKGSVEPVRLMPWSEVYRVLTDKGYLYLKKMTKPFSIEAKLIQHLSKKHQSMLPKIVDYDETHLVFIMEEAGSPLRYRLKEKYEIVLINKALTLYANLQKESINEVSELIELGVPDWRLEKLPGLYQKLLNFKDLFIKDGLDFTEFEALVQLAPKFENLCQQLGQYRIPETLEHGDFQDNNFLIQNNHLTINDWGDSVISHPFFSLISFLWSAKRNHNLLEGSENYLYLKSRYLNQWLEYESSERIEEAFQIATKINSIKFVNNFHRTTLCPGMETLGEYQGTMAKALRLFIYS